MRMDELISRESALEALRKCQTYLFEERDPDKKIELRSAEWAIEDLPSAHPELDKWCTDCKEYDHERHCCPRYNRVIRETLAEIREAPSAEPEADKVARDIATIIENEKDMRIILADERLEPKKPYTYYSNPPYKTLLARCTNCKRPLRPGRTYRNPDLYCPRCGQAIDWSEV